MVPAQTFARALGGDPADAAFSANVAERLAEAEASCPCAPPLDAFARFVAARLDDQRPLAEAFASLRLADLWLVCACLEDVPGAVDVFAARHRADLEAVARKAARRTGREPDDLVQRVLVRLLVGDASRSPRLALYRGEGPLAGFVQVTAARVAVDVGAARKDEPEAEERLFARLTGAGASPETDLGRARNATAVREAFGRACASLAPRARGLLYYALCEGLSVDVLGRMYGVHRATVARWVQDAREALVVATRGELRRTLAVSDAAAQSVLRDALSRLELSVARHLGAPGAAPEAP